MGPSSRGELTIPVQTDVPSGLSDVVWIDANGNSSLAVRADGTFLIWGAKEAGPVPDMLMDASQSLLYGSSGLVLTPEGTVRTWRSGGQGQTLSNVRGIAKMAVDAFDGVLLLPKISLEFDVASVARGGTLSGSVTMR